MHCKRTDACTPYAPPYIAIRRIAVARYGVLMCPGAMSCFFFLMCRGNQNISLALHWNIVPNAGTLPRFNTGKTFFKFSDRYWSVPR